jgi:hypothetical protein
MEDDFDDLAYLREQVGILITGGFFNEDDLETFLTELAFDPHSAPHASSVRGHARAAFAAKRVAEADWPPVTDWDRLAAAFTALEAAGILALHNAGTTTSDAHSDAWDLIGRDAKGAWRGFAFYHGQDVERAISSGALYIGFDAVAEGSAAKQAVGAAIVAALKAKGFAPEWNGDPETRLNVPGIVWQKRTLWVRPAASASAAARTGFWRRLVG